ncbi:Os05g0350600, partial [Oryza sativa Japonica Group]
AIRFGSVENCKKFKDLVEEISESLAKTEGKETEEDSSAAGLLEKLSVTEKKSEEVATKEESTEAVKETDTKSAATSE